MDTLHCYGLRRCYAHLFDENFRQEGGDRYVWLEADPCGDCCIGPAGDVADDQTAAEARHDWLAFELDAVGWDGLLDVNHDAATWLLREGLAPGQPFLVWLRPHYSRDYWGEHDLDVEWDVVARTHRSPEEAAAAWQAWIDAGYE